MRRTTRSASTAASSARPRWSPSGSRATAIGRSWAWTWPSEDRAFWTAFLRSLVKRGLTGVRLVISDAHEGLTAGHQHRAPWRDVAALSRALHAQPAGHRAARRAGGHRRDRPHDLRAARPRLRHGAAPQGGRRPAAALCDDRDAARGRRGGHPGLPASAGRRTSGSCTARTRWSGSTRRSSGGRTSSASFRIPPPSSGSSGRILLEQDDEWAVAERRYFSAESMQQTVTPSLSSTAQEILAAIA